MKESDDRINKELTKPFIYHAHQTFLHLLWSHHTIRYDTIRYHTLPYLLLDLIVVVVVVVVAAVGTNQPTCKKQKVYILLNKK